MFLVPPDLGRSTGPSWRTAMRNVFLLALTPGIALWLAISAFGKLLTGPLKSWNYSESDLNRSLQHTRTPFWDSVTAVWSHIGNTEIVIGVCLIAVALVFWRTRRWWFAVIPAIAVSLQAAVFVAATVVTGRPRPDVPHLVLDALPGRPFRAVNTTSAPSAPPASIYELDPAPPTSSYPSGHVGASVALYASLAIMATTIERTWLRPRVIAVCSLIPVLVAYARLYRGMHHLSDVIVGAINGLICAGLAAYCLYRTPKAAGSGQR